ncbi:hypothetical protein BJ742DRAFT_811024 [Cladochytrium replicatum]|nr:hypothetical protein BJ742DRAFT_811024 [Cladochytrium replicatum]
MATEKVLSCLQLIDSIAEEVQKLELDLSQVRESDLTELNLGNKLKNIRKVKYLCVQLEDAIVSSRTKGKKPSAANNPALYVSENYSDNEFTSVNGGFGSAVIAESGSLGKLDRGFAIDITDSPIDAVPAASIPVPSSPLSDGHLPKRRTKSVPTDIPNPFGTTDTSTAPDGAVEVENDHKEKLQRARTTGGRSPPLMDLKSSKSLPGNAPTHQQNSNDADFKFKPVTPETFLEDSVYIAAKDYVAPKDSDLHTNLRMGDRVHAQFYDGSMVFGKNLATGVEGCFPLNVIVPPEEFASLVNSQLPPSKKVTVKDVRPLGKHVSQMSYAPLNDDEVVHQIGDEIQVTAWLNEDTGLGINMRTREQGFFRADTIKFKGGESNVDLSVDLTQSPEPARPIHHMPPMNNRLPSRTYTHAYSAPAAIAYPDPANNPITDDENIPVGIPIMRRIESLNYGHDGKSPASVASPMFGGGIDVRNPTVGSNMNIRHAGMHDRDTILATIAAFQNDYAAALKIHMTTLEDMKRDGKDVPLDMELDVLRRMTLQVATNSPSFAGGAPPSPNPSNDVSPRFPIRQQTTPIMNQAPAAIPRPRTYAVPGSNYQHVPERPVEMQTPPSPPQPMVKPAPTKPIQPEVVISVPNISVNDGQEVASTPQRNQPVALPSISGSVALPSISGSVMPSISGSVALPSISASVGLPSISGSIANSANLTKDQRRATDLRTKMVSVIEELYQTEKNYANDLGVLMERVVTPVRDIPTPGRATLFRGIKELEDLSKTMCATLERIGDPAKRDPQKMESAPQIVAAVFLRNVENWGSYVEYVKHYSVCKQTIRELQDQQGPAGERFRAILKDLAKYGKKDIDAYLILPIQRIGQYKLILPRLKECVDEGTTRECIDAAALFMSEIGKILNQAQKYEESMQKMFKVLKLVKGCPPDIVSATRRTYVNEFDAKNVEKSGLAFRTGSRRLESAMFYLFSDCFLICSPIPSRGTGYSYQFAGRIVLTAVTVLEDSPSPDHVTLFVESDEGYKLSFSVQPKVRQTFISFLQTVKPSSSSRPGAQTNSSENVFPNGGGDSKGSVLEMVVEESAGTSVGSQASSHLTVAQGGGSSVGGGGFLSGIRRQVSTSMFSH